MKKIQNPIEKLFTNIKMSWILVIIFAICCGVIVGRLMIPAGLSDTSFQRPGITFEFWVAAALFIILNCKKPVEAGLKTFVFFLISQPLIYLVQVPYASMHWKLFTYYPKWGIITLFTFPGGIIAWYVKKKSYLSVLILSIANFIICEMLAETVCSMMQKFPKYLVAVIFMIAELVIFTLIIFKDKKKRLFSFLLILIMLASCLLYEYNERTGMTKTFKTTIKGKAPFEVLSSYNGVKIEVEGNELFVTMDYYGDMPIDLKDKDGNIITITFKHYESGTKWIQ